ncbi:MAG TPA: cysteine desulfurase family protein [Acidimicrobiales bacterium]|nr:cysteine desulfurase family protein [Acidimicrobiales bacterium]
MPRHYLDHASTSPARPEVIDAMLPWLSAADPGRVHTEGRMARVAIEDAREKVAALFGARPREVVFTSGATEAINAAVWGATERMRGGVVVMADVEHSAVREASERLAPITTIAVDRLGRVDADAIPVGNGVALVHCQWGNHEVGTLQPVARVVERCREAGVLVHVDAAQAAGRVPVSFGDADLMSVSAHKFGGPKGVGALLVRRGLRLDPFILGGEQERARRGGLENVPAIVGFGAAATLPLEVGRHRALTEQAARAALAIPGVTRYGDPDERLPHIACLGVEGVEAEAVLLGLDQAGIAAHSGSACSSESLEPSPVLQAMGVDAERSLRVSTGWSTTEEDVDALADALPRVIERLRALR